MERIKELERQRYGATLQLLEAAKAYVQQEIGRICAGLHGRTVTFRHTDIMSDNIVIVISGRGRVAFHEIDYIGNVTSSLKNRRFCLGYAYESAWRCNTKHHKRRKKGFVRELDALIGDYAEAMNVANSVDMSVTVEA